MAKYNKKIIKHICSLIRADSYTIAEICALSGISKETYYTWLETHSDFSDAIEKAKEEFDNMIVAEAKKSLVKKIKGYTVQERKVVTVDSGSKDPKTGKSIPKIKEQVVVDKTFQPDTGAIIFALTNKAPDEYQNKFNGELTGKGGKDLIPSMTEEQLNARIAELEKKLKN